MQEKKQKDCKKAGRNRSLFSGSFEKKAPKNKGVNRQVAQFTRSMNTLIPGAGRRLAHATPTYGVTIGRLAGEFAGKDPADLKDEVPKIHRGWLPQKKRRRS